MIFRQLFEPLSSTYTYLLGCEDSREAILVDPVYPTWERDRKVLRDLGLTLSCTVETHVHADHITSARRLRDETGCKVAFPEPSRCECADVQLEDGKPLVVGSVELLPVFTPGHTDDHFSYRVPGKVLTGDALLIDGCGRTDFQNGDSATLFRSIRERLFTLPEDTLVFPGHDYNQRRVSTVQQERDRNPRVGDDRTREEFIELMGNLGLAYPRFIDHAVPGNKACGKCPEDLPENMEAYCNKMTDSPQG